LRAIGLKSKTAHRRQAGRILALTGRDASLWPGKSLTFFLLANTAKNLFLTFF
jgi:hypothetical protein